MHNAEQTASWTDRFGLTSRTASALADGYDSLDDLLDAYRAGDDLTDLDGVGRRTSFKVTTHIEEEHPEAVRTRLENDEGVCLTFTTDHGLDEADLESDTFYWAFVCPRCEATNPMQGDPDGFKGRPYACETCQWVALLEAEALGAFRGEHFQEADSA